MYTNQENRHLAELVQTEKVQFGAGDFNLGVSTPRGPSHTFMTQISTTISLQYLPPLAYHNEKLCQESVSNVHVRTAGHCYDMCLVPHTNHTFSVEFVAIPGDIAYLLTRQTIIDGDSSLKNAHVVHYYNRKRSDHRIMLIKSW